MLIIIKYWRYKLATVNEYQDLIKLYMKLYSSEESMFYNCDTLLDFIDDCRINIKELEESVDE